MEAKETSVRKSSPQSTLHSREPVRFPPHRSFISLSIRDLLEAREAHHVHLANMENVVGTAIGRYLIQKGDWYAEHPPTQRRPKEVQRLTTPRTLEDSVITAWSWPCVLVFVCEWAEPGRPNVQYVPRRLYLPDGRVVPTCVVLAPPDESPAPVVADPGARASRLLGGSYPCIRLAQGKRNVGTIGCLVQRGGTYYALTTRHVAGTPGGVVEVAVRGELERIGIAEGAGLGKQAMSSIFPEWPGLRALVNLDAGLVLLDDVSRWTAQVFGIGEVGEIYDATASTVTLDLIGLPLRAFGGISGVLEGEIKALFFRYQHLGGDDYVADLLIGARAGEPRTDARAQGGGSSASQPGDSGAIWFYDPPTNPEAQEDEDVFGAESAPERGARARRLRPIALQWGGARIALPDGRRSALALGTFLSSVCRGLDVEIVRGYGIGHDEYWGKLAHFAIGWKACDLLGDEGLGALMRANQANIGFGNADLGLGAEFRVDKKGFVPLADVPDYVWVMSRSAEGQQHFADIDIPAIDGGPSLLERYEADQSLSAAEWRDYFRAFKEAGVGPGEGSLPFRIWQIWDEMASFLAAGHLERFVAAAGVLAHYVADASMPFHVSYLHHGRLPMVRRPKGEYPVAPDSAEYLQYKKSREAKIHAIYDEQVLETATGEALDEIDAAIADAPKEPADIGSGREAGLAAMKLMSASYRALAPEEIIAKDDPALSAPKRAERLWRDPAVRNAIVQSVSASTLLLARLWESAWQAGLEQGFSPETSILEGFTREHMMRVYKDAEFLPAMTLEEMVASGRF